MTNGIRLAVPAVAVLAVFALGAVVLAGDAHSQVVPISGLGTVDPSPSCTVWAKRGTNYDATVTGSGTLADPFVGRDSPEALVAALRAGDVGCLGPGTYDLNGPGSGLNDAGEAALSLTGAGTSQNRKVLQGRPNSARPVIVGNLNVATSGDFWTVRGLSIDGSGGPTTSNASNQNRYGVEAALRWYGTDGQMWDNEVYMGAQRLASQDNLPGAPDLGTCAITGSSADPALRLSVEGNWFHNCGVAADFYDGARRERQTIGGQTVTWTGQEDNHCLYSNNADDGVVEGNLLHDCAESGVNLYPSTTGGLYKGNVVVRSEVNFAVNGTTGNTIRNNVISNPFGPSNLNLSNGATATIRDNCAWLGYGRTGSGLPASATGTLMQNPQFANLPPNTVAGWNAFNDDYTVGNAACAAKLEGS